MPDDIDRPDAVAGLSRRRFLTGGTAVVGGAAAVAGGAAGFVAGRATEPHAAAGPAPDAAGRAVEPFHGRHQAGVTTARQAVGAFVALDVTAGTDRAALVRLMRLWTEDAARLTQGIPTLADTEPALAAVPARLTVTVGFGPGLLAAAGLAELAPPWLRPLPPFPTIDRLEDRWSGGDLLLQLGADDPTTLSHAQRMLLRSARRLASVRWVQPGFTHGPGTRQVGATMRNLMGQLDGTTNPVPGTDDFDSTVWTATGPEWIRGGTGLVLRRIRMEMDSWDALSRQAKEQVVGRTLDTGAPLTGAAEHDTPDFAAVGPDGLTVIPQFAHIRVAHDDAARFLRRPLSYDAGPRPDGSADVGLLFAAYAADPSSQYVPVQQRLAEQDLLNTWTTPIGSAVFALPPGCQPGGYLGETLLG